jgi:hypothetical protein
MYFNSQRFKAALNPRRYVNYTVLHFLLCVLTAKIGNVFQLLNWHPIICGERIT